MMPAVGLNRTGKTVTHKTVTHKTVTDKTPTLTKLGKKPRLARPDRNPCVVHSLSPAGAKDIFQPIVSA